MRGDLRVRHLTFAYDTGPVVLHDIDLHVPAGSTLAIVGATGSGKSSLVHLLVRMYDPPPGTVFIDGHDVRDVRLEDLRRAIAFVPQETFLFSTTLEDNIAFGAHAMPDAERRARVEDAAAIARLDKDVVQFAEGYQTRVGERGLTLSGGQKQRTAIARALMTGAPVLVFDDALSAVDTYTEEEILSPPAHRHSQSDHHHRRAPHFRRPSRRPDHRPRRGPDHRTRHARLPGVCGWPL